MARGDPFRGNVACDESVDAGDPLVLHCCTHFLTRLLGWHARTLTGTTSPQGVYLQPCRAIHTFGMRVRIDVVFVDAQLNELKRVDAMRPHRMAMCWQATAAIELPAGYCKLYSDYLDRIKLALQCQARQ